MQKTVIDKNGFAIYRGHVHNPKFKALVAAENQTVVTASPSEFHRWDGREWVEDAGRKAKEMARRDALKKLVESDKNIPRRLEDLFPLLQTMFTNEQLEQASPGVVQKIAERQAWRSKL